MSTAEEKIREAIGLDAPIFYAEGGIAFARIKEGKVAVVGVESGRVFIIEPNTWCSAVASVSLHGDNADTFASMEEFHLGKTRLA